MPRTRSLAWSELKIGVLAIAAIVITSLTIFLLTGSRGFFWQRYSLKTRFDNVFGLKGGSPVRVAGVEVGSVTDVTLSGEHVEVTFDVNKDQRERITTQSTAALGSISLLGEYAVDITPSTQGTPIPDFGYVPSQPPKAQLADIADTANKSIEGINSLVGEIRAGRGTVGKLMTDEQLYVELRKFVATAGEVTRTIQQGRGTVGKLLNDRKTADALEASMANLEAMTRRMNAGEGSLGRLMNDDAFSQSLTGATDNLRTLTDRLNRGEGTAGKLMTDPALFNRLNDVTARMNDLVTKLNEGEGTMGQLLKDKQLYENMNGAVNEFRTLITEIKKDPRKYLNIRVSVF
jgi:phospholipid/cholesterol/gamma-HCH transport system substrate-binding protein